MKYKIKTIDNRDINTTELELENGDRVTLDYQQSVEILLSFMTNNLEQPDKVKEMLDTLSSNLQFCVFEYLP